MPDWKLEIRKYLPALNLSPTHEAEIAEELSQHLQQRFDELVASGKSDAESRQTVHQELGSGNLFPVSLRRNYQEPITIGEKGSSNIMNDLWQDIRYAIRTMKKNAAFTAVALLTLTIAIGANTAIFSVVNSVLLQALPYPNADRLVIFWGLDQSRGSQKIDFAHGMFAYSRDHSHSFEKMAAYQTGSLTLTGVGEPERIDEADVTYDFFNVLGRQPMYGRGFLPEEDKPNTNPKFTNNNSVVVLSYELWQRRFNGDQSIIGKAINLNNSPLIVIGIMPPGFNFPQKAQMWIPVGLDPGWNTFWNLTPIGRLKPNVKMADAHREIADLTSTFRKDHALQSNPGASILMMPLLDSLVGDVKTPLLVLMGAVALVLLIACANIANLLLARATIRTREMAVRSCLGASSGRILRQLLTESSLLALFGSIGGLALAFFALQILKSISISSVPRIEGAHIDLTVLGFTIGVALLTGLLFGLVPALRSARINLQDAIKEGSRGSSSGTARRINNVFVVAQFALSLVLLVGAGLLLQSFRNLLAVDPGFRAENVLVGRIELPQTKYTDKTQVNSFYSQMLERLQRLPGSRTVGLGSQVPLNNHGDGHQLVVEGNEPGPNDPVTVIFVRSVTPGYIEAMGIPLLRGRTFQTTDTETSQPVTIIDETTAKIFFANEDPIGKHIKTGGPLDPWLTIVGVVPSVKKATLDESSKYYLYQPLTQRPVSAMYAVIRTERDPEMMINSLRGQITSLDSELALFDVHTMEQAVADTVSTKRLTNALLTAFAITALLLACLGVYGVMSLNVSARTNEFGIRMALGAQRGDVLGSVLRQGMILTAIGIAIGLGGALVLTRSLESLLFHVKTSDPFIYTGVALMLGLTAAFACFVPARRATKVDPMVALRYE